MKKWDNFFGSKLNSVLLIILIVLLVMVLLYMRKNKEAYEENNYLFNNLDNIEQVY